MRINPDIRLRRVAGECMLINECARSVNFNSMYSLNDVAAWIWEQFCELEFSEEDIVRALMGEFEVDEPAAAADVHALLDSWKQYGFIL